MITQQQKLDTVKSYLEEFKRSAERIIEASDEALSKMTTRETSLNINDIQRWCEYAFNDLGATEEQLRHIRNSQQPEEA